MADYETPFKKWNNGGKFDIPPKIKKTKKSKTKKTKKSKNKRCRA